MRDAAPWIMQFRRNHTSNPVCLANMPVKPRKYDEYSANWYNLEREGFLATESAGVDASASEDLAAIFIMSLSLNALGCRVKSLGDDIVIGSFTYDPTEKDVTKLACEHINNKNICVKLWGSGMSRYILIYFRRFCPDKQLTIWGTVNRVVCEAHFLNPLNYR